MAAEDSCLSALVSNMCCSIVTSSDSSTDDKTTLSIMAIMLNAAVLNVKSLGNLTQPLITFALILGLNLNSAQIMLFYDITTK